MQNQNHKKGQPLDQLVQQISQKMGTDPNKLRASAQKGDVSPVSYTHLDVYKRQPLGSIFDLAGANEKSDNLAGWRLFERGNSAQLAGIFPGRLSRPAAAAL